MKVPEVETPNNLENETVDALYPLKPVMTRECFLLRSKNNKSVKQ